MPLRSANAPLPSPWNQFLTELDSFLKEPLELHCIGGFILVHFYGLDRTTADIDYFTSIPARTNLDDLAGEGSPLHKKYGVYLHRAAIMSLTEDYETRLQEMLPGTFKNLNLRVLDPYDCILSKIERNGAKDRDDADYLFRSQKLNSAALRERYMTELRPYMAQDKLYDQTLDLWIEIFESPRT